MKYLLTYQIELDALDDADARLLSKAVSDELDITRLKRESDFVFDVKNKLQQIEDNKPPRKIEL